MSSVVTAPETNIENSEHISPRLELIDLPFLNENNCNRHKRKHASDKTKTSPRNVKRFLMSMHQLSTNFLLISQKVLIIFVPAVVKFSLNILL